MNKKSDSDNNDFLLERRLKELDPALHRNLSDTIVSLQYKILFNYQLLFPSYTDHTELHCVTVIDFCNRLIGREQLYRMSADER